MPRRRATAKTTPVHGNPGLRERKKALKAETICNVARQLFTTKGYEATTLREVAQLADVGFGTVSSYASDKAGLLAMVYVRDLQDLPSPFEGAPANEELLESLTRAFITLFEFWARNPPLSRIVLPQMEFYGGNPFIDVILARRAQLKTELEGWIRRLQKQRRVRPSIDPAQAAGTFFAIYTSCLREWIASEPLEMAKAHLQLERLLALPLSAIERAAR